jgi:hypothetical protein
MKNKKGTVLGGIISKIFNLFTGNKSASGNTGGASENASTSGSSASNAIVKGDATEGRRAPYTGTADGIGLGDGRVSRSNQNQTGKVRSMSMNATANIFGGRGNTSVSSNPSNFVELSSMNAHPLVSNSAAAYAARTRDMVPRNIVQKLAEKRAEAMKRVSNKEPVTNLTELTDKTIEENRKSADQKTQKQVATAIGTSDVITTPNVKPYQSEGGALAQPNIKKSKYLVSYNTTSQF